MPGMTRNWAWASDEAVSKTSDRVRTSFHMERISTQEPKELHFGACVTGKTDEALPADQWEIRPDQSPEDQGSETDGDTTTRKPRS